MNKETARDYLPLVQALAEGRVIQIVTKGGWKELANYDFTSPVEHYRIKPEPREIWVNRFPDGHDALTWYETEEAAHRAYGRVGAVQVRYREVIE